MRSMLWILGVAAIAAGACRPKERTAERSQPAGQPAMGDMTMDRMPMGGGNVGMGGAAMMPLMRAHMDSLVRMTPEQMSAAMAAHDRMMSQMMDRMGADMRSMNMSADAGWNALVDSVKADLADLPALQGTELSTHMTAHAARVQRLMGMHEGMMRAR